MYAHVQSVLQALPQLLQHLLPEVHEIQLQTQKTSMQDHQEHPLQTFVHQTLQGILQKVLAETQAVQTSQPRIHYSCQDYQTYETKISHKQKETSFKKKAASWSSKEEPSVQKKGCGSSQEVDIYAHTAQGIETYQEKVQ